MKKCWLHRVLWMALVLATMGCGDGPDQRLVDVAMESAVGRGKRERPDKAASTKSFLPRRSAVSSIHVVSYLAATNPAGAAFRGGFLLGISDGLPT